MSSTWTIKQLKRKMRELERCTKEIEKMSLEVELETELLADEALKRGVTVSEMRQVVKTIQKGERDKARHYLKSLYIY